MLVETGNGDKFSAKLKDIYGIDHDRAIGDALREVGLSAGGHRHVVMSHLHFDHSGGTTRRTASGGFVPVFARARHVVQRREWEDATHPHERNRASYLQENIGPLGEAGPVAARRRRGGDRARRARDARRPATPPATSRC